MVTPVVEATIGVRKSRPEGTVTLEAGATTVGTRLRQGVMVIPAPEEGAAAKILKQDATAIQAPGVVAGATIVGKRLRPDAMEILEVEATEGAR